MEKNNELRHFLRTSRARLRPGDVGLADANGYSGTEYARRVPGLRREEVARLAGVSVDYYARLEQGRAQGMSESVLAAIAGALQLSQQERDYLFALVGTPSRSSAKSPVSVPQRVRPSIRTMLSAFARTPALVMGRGMQLLAMNELARAILFDMDAVPVRDRNLAKWIFLAPEARDRFADWDDIASEAAAVLRAEAGVNPDDPVLNELIGELSVKSPEFRCMWSEHKVRSCAFGSKRLIHPIAGRLTLDYEALAVPGVSDQKVVAYIAAEGSPSSDGLNLLASWIARPVGDPRAPVRPQATDAADR